MVDKPVIMRLVLTAMLCLLGSCALPIFHEALGESKSESPMFCVNSTVDDKCIDDKDCKRTMKKPCYHGDCADNGACICHACWTGPSCNLMANEHAPVFRESRYVKYISPDEDDDSPFLYVQAFDKDSATCAASTTGCPCAKVLYSLGDAKNGAKSYPFTMDAESGGISVVPGARLDANSNFTLKAYGRNGRDPVNVGTVEVVVIVSQGYLGDGQQSVKLRKLQAASEMTSMGENDTLQISFRPGPESQATGTLALGSRVDCVLTITIPESVLVENMKVELFTDDANNTLSVMCPPAFTKGEEIEITDTSEAVKSYHVANNPFMIDTAAYTLGNVTNLNTSTSVDASKIVITFSITMHEDMDLGAEERYWVSAGVEYNGESKLWIGQIGFLVDQQAQYPLRTNMSIDGPSDYYKDEVEVFSVDFNVYRRLANMTVDAIAGVSIKPHLLICEMTLCNTGTGFCLDADLDLATYEVDPTSQNVYESIFKFGHIVNGGAGNNTKDSLITMDVVTYLRNDDAVAAGSSYDLTVTANDGTHVTQDTQSFIAKAHRPFITDARLLTINVTFEDGDADLAPGESVKVRVHIAVPYSTSVSPVKVSLEPQNHGDQFEICAVRINHIGEDISCLLQRRDAIESSVVYGAGPSATIDLRGIANTGSESNANGVNDVIGVDFVVKSKVTTGGSSHTLSVTVTQGSATGLTGAIVVNTITDPGSINYPSVPNDAPNPVNSTFDLMNPADDIEIAPGEFILLAIRPVIQPDTMYKYTATALVNTTDVIVLDMRVVMASTGGHIACGISDDLRATYTGQGDARDVGELDLGLVYNFGRPGTPTTPTDDGFEIQLAVMAREAAADGNAAVAVSLMAGASRLWVAEGNITVKTSSAMTPVTPTNNTITLVPTYTEEVMPNHQSKLLHTLVIPANTSSKYLLNYTTTSWLQIVNINITSVGENLLCTQADALTPVYADSGMYGTLDLGYVCNVPTYVVNATDEVSTITIELTVYATNTSETEVGSKALLTAELDVLNILGSTYQESKHFVLSAALPKSEFKLCCPSSATYMSPGETTRCNVTMDILDKALLLSLELKTRFNKTAGLSLNNVELGPPGSNIQYTTPDIVMKSSANTSQNDQASMDFGLVVNTGDVANLQAGSGNNDVVIYMDVQMTDGEFNTNGSKQSLQAGIGVGHGIIIWVSYYAMTVIRDGSEKPDLNVTFTTNASAATQHSVGDKVWYEVDIAHTPDSKAEVLNLKGHIFLPPYIRFDRMMTNFDISSIQPDIEQSHDGSGFYFTMSKMLFNERAAFTLETTIRSDYRYKMIKNWKGTTPIEVVYYMLHYDENYYTNGQYFSKPMDYVTYDIIIPYPEIPGLGPNPTCLSPVARGMEAGTIQDCQITASYSPDPLAPAEHARLNGLSAWKTPARAGPFLYDRWIKVDLGKKTAVTGVKTQGGSSATADGDLGEFEVLYSLDDTLYKAASPSDNKKFDHQKDAPNTHDTVVINNFRDPVEARYILLNLTAYNYNGASKWYNALRMEIMGCDIDLTDANDICPTTNTPQVTEEYDRGFLADTITNTLFVCDTITHGKSGLRKELHASVYTLQWKKPNMQCYMMTYDTKQWTGLDSRLRNIIGFLPSTGRLYGVMGNSPDSYAASDKPYNTWFLTAKTDYDTATSTTGFVQSVSVPLVSDSATGFEYSTPDKHDTSSYAIGEWKATMSGIFKGTEKVLDWNQCCQPTCAANGGPDNCT